MCDFAIDTTALAERWKIDVAAYFASEFAKLAALARDGLVALCPGRLQVSAKGRLLIRNVCMVFDNYIGKPSAVPLQRVQYSRTI
jgi:oxygen-independent coproporphyrinogen-3 oxidase